MAQDDILLYIISIVKNIGSTICERTSHANLNLILCWLLFSDVRMRIHLQEGHALGE